MLNGHSILITGGTGSFGHAFIDHALKNHVGRVVVYSRDEFKQYQMAQEFPDKRVRFFIGDVRDGERLERACKGIDYIIHAAAMKHVPICEYNPFEAVKTNVLGAMNVVNAALSCGVKKVVALSTDKAVHPINLYGATKLCSDKIFASANAYSGRKGTVFGLVRYGNVANSRGSVIPHFKALMSKGFRTLPVTDERMTRFYATLDDAVKMVEIALEHAQGGEVFVKKIPSFKIVDLVKFLKCDYEIIGIRPGEKLNEIMITSEDSDRTFDNGEYYIIYPNYEWFKNEPQGIKVHDGFEYRSDVNDNWLFR